MHKDNSNQAKIFLWKRLILILCGIFFSIVLLELGLRLGGFIYSSLQEYRNKVSLRQKGTYRIMCLGESTTAIGGRDSYPSQLEEVLNQRNTGIKFSVINKGIVNGTSNHIIDQLEDNLNRYYPDMVTVMMGINDDDDIKYYEDIPDADTILFKKFRTYRWIRIMWKLIIEKIKRSDLYESKEKKVVDEISNLELKEYQFKQEDSFKTEELLKKAIELNPKNYQAYVELGWYYIEEGKFNQVEEPFKKAIELNPLSQESYLGLGEFYATKGRYIQAEELFKKAIESNPRDDWVYAELGRFYRKDGKFTQAEQLLRKAIELNPRNDKTYTELSSIYLVQGKHLQAEELFKKAIELNPRNDSAYIELGNFYLAQGKHLQAEELFKKAIKFNPTYDEMYIDLSWVYLAQGKHLQAEELFKKAIELNPRNDSAYAALAVLYRKMDKYESAEEYYKKANALQLYNYYPITKHNYLKLKEILDKRGIRLVCLQYPMRSIEPLKKIFETQKNVIFVDNERIFKEALRKVNHTEYFTDMFAGDFGHCTHKGNRLLAENIADAILKEVQIK